MFYSQKTKVLVLKVMHSLTDKKTRTSHRETNKFCKNRTIKTRQQKTNKPQFVEQGTARVYLVNRAVPEPECCRRRIEKGRVKARGRTTCLLEVALNFLLVLKEIKSHQQAELQLISKRTKTVDTTNLIKNYACHARRKKRHREKTLSLTIKT